MLLAGAPVFLFVSGFGYGLVMGFTGFRHVPKSSDSVAYHEFIQRDVAKEMSFIMPITAITFILGISGFVLLLVGLIRYFISRKAA